jgi:ankyrin repeat protein
MKISNRLPALALVLSALAFVVSARAADDTPLVDAAKHKNWAEVRALLKEKAPVDTALGDGSTALLWAVYWDNADVVTLLVQAGANVNAATDLGVTPLYLAASNGNAATVQRLLDKGADPNLVSAAGVSPLMRASQVGGGEAVRLLVAHGARVNEREPSRGQTALMWAAAQRHPDVTRVLIENGAEVSARTRVRRLVVNRGGPNGTIADEPYVGDVDKGGSTPLLFAARSGDLESAKLLVAAGAGVNDRAADGYSAMQLASHSGHGELALWLLDHGANPNAAEAGFTTLHTAVLTGDLPLVKALLSHGANPNAKITKATPIRRLGEDLALPTPLLGATPFFLAAKYADVPILRALAAGGADPLVPAADGTTALMAAAGVGWAGTTNRRGIDVTANKAAASDPHEDEPQTLELVKLLVGMRGDVNAKNRNGETALSGAVSKGFASVVKYLADQGADVHVKNKRGQSLLVLTEPRGTTGTPAPMLQATAKLLRQLGVSE